jgi:putative transcription factor
MQKRNKGREKEQKMLDKKFEKYAAMLPQSYKDQFKREVKKPTQKQKVNEAIRQGRKTETVQKGQGNKNDYVQNVGKLLNEDIEIKEVPREIAIQVARARNEKKLTQEQLANKVQENLAAIKDLENAEGAYNPKLVEKIEKILQVKFERSWKK